MRDVAGDERHLREITSFNYDTVLSGLFATDINVTWSTSTGVFLGSTSRDYLHSGDYKCIGSCNISYFGGQYGLNLR